MGRISGGGQHSRLRFQSAEQKGPEVFSSLSSLPIVSSGSAARGGGRSVDLWPPRAQGRGNPRDFKKAPSASAPRRISQKAKQVSLLAAGCCGVLPLRCTDLVFLPQEGLYEQWPPRSYVMEKSDPPLPPASCFLGPWGLHQDCHAGW